MLYQQGYRLEIECAESIHARVSIHFNGKKKEVNQPRWVWLICLLAYMRITGANNCRVSLSDLQKMHTFKNVQPASIGKHYMRALENLHDPIKQFIRTYIKIDTKGPYELFLLPEKITVDTKKLKNYVRLWYHGRLENPSESSIILKTAIEALQKYNFHSSMSLYHHYLRLTLRSSDLDARIERVKAYHRIAEIEHLIKPKSNMPTASIKNALRLCNKLEVRDEKDLLLATILNTQALNMSLIKENIPKIEELDRQSVSLVRSVPGNDPDKLAVLATRLFHRYYVAKRFDPKKAKKKELDKAKELFLELDKIPRFLLSEKGITYGIDFQLHLIELQNQKKPITKKELDWYQDIVDSYTVSRVISLNLAEWICVGLKRQHQSQDAYNFAINNLVFHAELHETVSFIRLRDNFMSLKPA